MGKVLPEPVVPKADLAKDRVKALEIAPAGAGSGVVGGQAVENFRGKAPRFQRWTSRNEPKLEKPAPKEASHQRPSGTPLRSAWSSAKRQEGLLILPWRRRTAALGSVCFSVSWNSRRRARSTSRPPACQIQPETSSDR